MVPGVAASVNVRVGVCGVVWVMPATSAERTDGVQAGDVPTGMVDGCARRTCAGEIGDLKLPCSLAWCGALSERARAGELPRAVPTTLSSSGLQADGQDFARRDLNGERNLPAPRRMAVGVLSLSPRARNGKAHAGLVCAKTVAGSVVKGNPLPDSTQTRTN